MKLWMINSDYIIFHLFEIYYHVLDKFSSNENNFTFIFFKDFLIKLGWYLKCPLEDMLTFFSSNSPSWIIFEKYIEILADIVINISAMTF